jgi:hypothetical protein
MKASVLCSLVLVCLLPFLSDFASGQHLPDQEPKRQSLGEYFEPGQVQEREPLPVRQIIGLVIAGLSSLVILLFVFSFLMGPGEHIREKVSETTDPFLTIVAILLVVLLLALVQNYYQEILAWLKTFVSAE